MRRPRPSFTAAALAAGLTLAACSPPPDDVAVREGAIIGGTLDQGDPSVVLLLAQNNQGAGICTAEIVSPHVVLTAAHCVSPQVIGNGNTFSIFLGYDINDRAQANNQANFYQVREVHWDPQFNVNNLTGGHDIAVVVTRNALPRPALPMNRVPLTQNDIGATLRLVGYGITSGRDTQGTSAGTKRQTTTMLYDYDNLLLYFNDPKHLTCEGDSGGPAFITRNGVEYIVGVTSFGDQGCMFEGADTRVDLFAASFVDKYITQFDGQQPQPMPDMAMSPPDLARPPAARDMAQLVPGQDAGAPAAPGTVGAVCMAHTDCNSRTCAFTTDTSGYCTQTCDPADTTTCPGGFYCGLIDGAYYCQRSQGFTGGRSGCSVAASSSGGDTAAGLAAIGLVLGAVVRLRRRRA